MRGVTDAVVSAEMCMAALTVADKRQERQHWPNTSIQ